MSPNLSLYSIPAYYALAMVPHVYSVIVVGKNKQRWDNAAPRSQNEKLKKSMPPKVYAQFERCRAAHNNMLESSAFFIGAVLAGNWAGLENGYMNSMTGWYLASRIAYLICYIAIERQRYSLFRTLAFNAGFLVVFLIFFKAAGAVYAKGAL
jgi:uncharacterized MAPEG superfamily protein